MSVYHQTFQDNFSIVKELDACSIDHWHQNVEMIYVLSGQAIIKIGNTVQICNAGDMAIVHSGEIHNVCSMENSALYICIFDAEMIQNLNPEKRYSQNFVTQKELTVAGISTEILYIFDEIYREYRGDDLWNDVMIRAGLMRIYTLLVRNFESINMHRPQTLAKIQHFKEVLFYIEENYAQNITLSDVAKAINYNPNYVSYLFVAYTGLNFKKYLDSFRVNKAIEIIKQTEYTFAEISIQCGFPNIRTFNNVFRRITGQTPTQLRNTSAK